MALQPPQKGFRDENQTARLHRPSILSHRFGILRHRWQRVEVQLGPSLKDAEKMPISVQQALAALLEDLREKGPV